MKNVKVLGTGCRNCQTTMRLIEEVGRGLDLIRPVPHETALAEKPL
jgi:hypothetical protein